jgi:energy-coupling factor transporter transmembrane protein EcfT
MSMANSKLMYPWEWYEFWKKDARLRKAQLQISIARLKQKVPFYIFLRVCAYVWFAATTVFWMFGWVYAVIVLTPENMFWWFIVYTILSALFLSFVLLHVWVMRYWPTTVKVQVGNSPEWTAAHHRPGSKLDQVEIIYGEGEDMVKESVQVELIMCGGVDNVPPSVARQSGPVLISRCFTQGKKGHPQAGFLQGVRYYIPGKPEPYIAGDMHNWRAIDWLKLAKNHFPEQITDFTPIVLALDPIDPETWEVPATPPFIQMELFQARARILQLETEFEDYVSTDGLRQSARERQGDFFE